MKRLLVTGAAGLIGSEVVAYFSRQGWKILGVDNNMRADFFGAKGDTTWNTARMEAEFQNYNCTNTDIRDRRAIGVLVESFKPDAVVHAAAQPSHDLAALRPYDDFDVNAVGTMNLLESVKRYSIDTPFVHLSTNKVYGDAVNDVPLTELETRWDYSSPEHYDGISESFSIDQSKHSLFGASKLAADILVQEYGRYFEMPTCCLRGGCLTGPNQTGVELHGFLSFLIRCNVERQKYTIFGYKGKQVRDNIHSYDVVTLIDQYIQNPRVAEVYNIGGGRSNSISILEAFSLISEISGIEMEYEYTEQSRSGDHICYISDLQKIKSHYPNWSITKDLSSTFEEIYRAWRNKT